MMAKVAYNACFGGFSLSLEAVQLGRSLSGEPRWAGITLPGEYYDDGSGPREPIRFGGKDSFHPDYSFPRHDATLIAVIEKLGSEASSGACARLKIAEVEGPYRIDEYDGSESVETPDSYEWIYPAAKAEGQP